MERLSFRNPDLIDDGSWNNIVSSFSSGSVIAYPTDTIYGFGCRADVAEAIDRIARIKGRKEDKAFIVLVSSLEMLERYCLLDDSSRESAAKLWDGERPTSIIFPYRGGLVPELLGEKSGLAVRLPKSSFLRRMIDEIGVPIVSTSANVSGQPHMLSGEEIYSVFIDKQYRPDLIIDAGIAENTRPSRLVSLLDGSVPLVIRE